MAPAVATYEPRDPSRTVLYHVIADHLETFLASLEADPDATGLPAYVQREFDAYLQCGILAYGFLRLGCDTCPKELLLPFSCKRRGFCPSCAARRMAQTAAHLVECVIPWVPTRQWVVSVPIPLRYWMAASQDLTATVQTIIRTTIGQYYVNQAVTRGVPRDQVQPGSVTFLQRFGSALNLQVFDVDCVYFAEPLSVLLAPLRHGVGSRVLIPLGSSLKERFVEVCLLVVIIFGIHPAAFVPSLHRLDGDAKLLGDLLLGDRLSCAQPLITRGELEAFAPR